MRSTTLASIAILAVSTAVMVQVASAPTEEKLSDAVVANVSPSETDDTSAPTNDEQFGDIGNAVAEPDRQPPK